MLINRFDSLGTPTSTYTDTTEQASRKRSACDAPTEQRRPSHDAASLTRVPREFRDKWDEVAGHETLVQLRLCLQMQRSTWTLQAGAGASTPESLNTGIRGKLSQYQHQRERWVRAVSDKHRLLAQVPWRLYLANVSNLYLEEKEARKEARKNRKRARKNRRQPATANVRQASVLDEFVDCLSPELESESIHTRNQAKSKFLNLMQCGERWHKLVERYGTGILLLIPSSITDDE